VRILFPGRLAEQKDPLLMLDVAERVIAQHHNVRLEVVGDGPLEAQVQARARERGLEPHLRFSPPTAHLARWLRSSDLLLMTSTFEGVPYVIYEAMAMGVPVVAPALPGNVELMRDGGGMLIDARDDVAAYSAAVCQLIEDDGLRKALGAASRDRMLREFALPDLAARQEALYDSLLASRPRPPAPVAAEAPPPPIRLGNRPVNGSPLVSVITPCFNHGRYLPEFMAGIDAQDYSELEIILVDDASTDPETIETLARLENDRRVRVLRQAENHGPSAARNAALSVAAGRYILPVDADNVLLPGAVRALVSQLQNAGERVGFIYPSFQYFGTRDYRFDAPAYNLFDLLEGNFIDTCSLLDREVFDAGLRYGEDIELGHEDWDLALALAAREVVGEPSREPVMLYRKQGFTRSDAVEYLRLPFWKEIQERRSEMFGAPSDVGAWGRFRGPAMRTKARWSPSLTVIPVRPLDFDDEEGNAVLAGLASQSCQDFELIAECPRAPVLGNLVVRRIPPGLTGSDVQRVQESLGLSPAPHLLLTSSPAELFADPTTVEKLLRGFVVDPELEAVALTHLASESTFPFRLVSRIDGDLEAHTLAWHRSAPKAGLSVAVGGGNLVADLGAALREQDWTLQWRSFPVARPHAHEPAGTRQHLELAPRWSIGDSASARTERKRRLKTAPALPAIRHDQIPRWTYSLAWMPPETLPLARHLNPQTGTRIVTNDRTPPPGYMLEFDLASIQRFAPPGTIRLVCRDGHFRTAGRGSARPGDEDELGHLEEVPLPLFVGIERAVLQDGSETLVVGTERDPVRGQAWELTFLGFAEGFPNEPVRGPERTRAAAAAFEGWPILSRMTDASARRHRYEVAVGAPEQRASSQTAIELGRLRPDPSPLTIPMWVDALGRLGTDECQPANPTPDPGHLLRWTLAPAGWRRFGDPKARARAVARRVFDSARVAARSAVGTSAPPDSGPRTVIGHVYGEAGLGRVQLFAASHPVLFDQFVTRYPREATDLGYQDVRSLGFVIELDEGTAARPRRIAIPWASRFGLAARQN
jgi:hypothetical protein